MRKSQRSKEAESLKGPALEMDAKYENISIDPDSHQIISLRCPLGIIA